MPTRSVTVRTLRLPGPPVPGAAGVRCGPSPGGIAPGATLLVRSLRCAADPGGAVPVDDALQAAAATAGRPARGPVGPAAPAVLFADRAELLAALAVDLADGELVGRWWWSVLFGRGGQVTAARATWTSHPAAVPAALDLLAARGRAAALSSAVAPAAAPGLTRAVLAGAGLPIGTAVDRHVNGSGTPADPRWQWHVPEAAVAPGLAPEHRALLAVGLGLRRAPGVLRAALTAPPPTSAVADSPRRPGAAPPSRRAPTRDAPAPPTTVPPARAPVEPPATGPVGRPAPDVRRPAPRDPDPAIAPHPPDRASPPGSRGPHTDPAPPGAPARLHDPSRPAPEPRTTEPRAAEPRVPEPWAPEPGALERRAAEPSVDGPPDTGRAGVPATPADEGSASWPVRLHGRTDTGLGGLFFLVGVGQHLGHYGDFGAPAHPGIGLDLWDYLTLLGGALLGPPVPPDPVWATLADLAGRPAGTPPGDGFVPPPWQLPPDWHAAVPADGSWFPPDGWRGPVADWTAALAVAVRARCARAMGCAPGEVAGLLLRRPAVVTTTPDTLEVAFSLAEHPIAVRLAGLDRDPGWVPAAGRSVAFRFS